MRTDELIRHMVEKSGHSMRGVSESMGRSPNYISSIFSQGSTPKADTLSDIARACGYSLQVRGHGETVPVDGGGR